MPLISVIIPVFNEEGNVQATYLQLKQVTAALSEYTFEFIFTDNHSTDRTFDLLSAVARQDPSVKVVRFARNFGFQRSVMTGYRLAQGAAAIQIDADLQDPPSMFGPMLEKWHEGFDVVVGVRGERAESRMMTGLRKLYYRLLKRVGGAHLLLDGGDFRLIDANIIEKLRHIDDAQPYVRGLTSSLARRQTGIPYDRVERRADRSKFPLSGLLRFAVDGFLANSTLPLRFALYAGLFMAAASAVLAFVYLVARLVTGSDWPRGFATTQILLLFGIGLNAIFLGIIGEYVGRIYDQVRRRPVTVVERALNFEDMQQVERRSAWAADAAVIS